MADDKSYIQVFNADSNPVFVEISFGHARWTLPPKLPLSCVSYVTYMTEATPPIPFYEQLSSHTTSYELSTFTDIKPAAVQNIGIILKMKRAQCEKFIGNALNDEKSAKQMNDLDEYLDWLDQNKHNEDGVNGALPVISSHDNVSLSPDGGDNDDVDDNSALLPNTNSNSHTNSLSTDVITIDTSSNNPYSNDSNQNDQSEGDYDSQLDSGDLSAQLASIDIPDENGDEVGNDNLVAKYMKTRRYSDTFGVPDNNSSSSNNNNNNSDSSIHTSISGVGDEVDSEDDDVDDMIIEDSSESESSESPDEWGKSTNNKPQSNNTTTNVVQPLIINNNNNTKTKSDYDIPEGFEKQEATNLKQIQQKIEYSGWLYKRASISGSNWKKRFFVLTEYSLAYYNSDSKSWLKGEIHVTGNCDTAELSIQKPYGYTFKFLQQGEDIMQSGLTLASETSDIRVLWIEQFNKVIAKAKFHYGVIALKRSALLGGFLDKEYYFLLNHKILTAHVGRKQGVSKIVDVINISRTTVIHSFNEKKAKFMILEDSTNQSGINEWTIQFTGVKKAIDFRNMKSRLEKAIALEKHIFEGAVMGKFQSGDNTTPSYRDHKKATPGNNKGDSSLSDVQSKNKSGYLIDSSQNNVNQDSGIVGKMYTENPNKPVVRIMFDDFKTSEGSINLRGLQNLSYYLGIFMSIEDMASTLDHDDAIQRGTGGGGGKYDLDYEHFMVWWRNNTVFCALKLTDPNVQKRIKISEIYRCFDLRNMGCVSRVDFRLIYQKLSDNNLLPNEPQGKSYQMNEAIATLDDDDNIFFNYFMNWHSSRKPYKDGGVVDLFKKEEESNRSSVGTLGSRDNSRVSTIRQSRSNIIAVSQHQSYSKYFITVSMGGDPLKVRNEMKRNGLNPNYLSTPDELIEYDPDAEKLRKAQIKRTSLGEVDLTKEEFIPVASSNSSTNVADQTGSGNSIGNSNSRDSNNNNNRNGNNNSSSSSNKGAPPPPPPKAANTNLVPPPPPPKANDSSKPPPPPPKAENSKTLSKDLEINNALDEFDRTVIAQSSNSIVGGGASYPANYSFFQIFNSIQVPIFVDIVSRRCFWVLPPATKISSVIYVSYFNEESKTQYYEDPRTHVTTYDFPPIVDSSTKIIIEKIQKMSLEETENFLQSKYDFEKTSRQLQELDQFLDLLDSQAEAAPGDGVASLVVPAPLGDSSISSNSTISTTVVAAPAAPAPATTAPLDQATTTTSNTAAAAAESTKAKPATKSVIGKFKKAGNAVAFTLSKAKTNSEHNLNSNNTEAATSSSLKSATVISPALVLGNTAVGDNKGENTITTTTTSGNWTTITATTTIDSTPVPNSGGTAVKARPISFSKVSSYRRASYAKKINSEQPPPKIEKREMTGEYLNAPMAFKNLSVEITASVEKQSAAPYDNSSNSSSAKSSNNSNNKPSNLPTSPDNKAILSPTPVSKINLSKVDSSYFEEFDNYFKKPSKTNMTVSASTPNNATPTLAAQSKDKSVSTTTSTSTNKGAQVNPSIRKADKSDIIPFSPIRRMPYASSNTSPGIILTNSDISSAKSASHEIKFLTETKYMIGNILNKKSQPRDVLLLSSASSAFAASRSQIPTGRSTPIAAHILNPTMLLNDNVSRASQTEDFEAYPELSNKSSYQVLMSERERVAKDFEMMKFETQKIRKELQNTEAQSLIRTKEEEVNAKHRISQKEENSQTQYLINMQELTKKKEELANEREQFLKLKLSFVKVQASQVEKLMAINENMKLKFDTLKFDDSQSTIRRYSLINNLKCTSASVGLLQSQMQAQQREIQVLDEENKYMQDLMNSKFDYISEQAKIQLRHRERVTNKPIPERKYNYSSTV